VYFRHRIGEKGAELILSESIRLHGPRALEAEVVMDTTAQEQAITHPTDTKLHAKIINQAVKMAKQAGVKLRQSYRQTVPKLLQAQRGWRQAKGRKRRRHRGVSGRGAPRRRGRCCRMACSGATVSRLRKHYRVHAPRDERVAVDRRRRGCGCGRRLERGGEGGQEVGAGRVGRRGEGRGGLQGRGRGGW
jgi:hypothetical protein